RTLPRASSAPFGVRRMLPGEPVHPPRRLERQTGVAYVTLRRHAVAGPRYRRTPRVRSRLKAALMSARCVKACGKFPSPPPRRPLPAGTALLGVEPGVVGVAEHLLEHERGLPGPGGVGAPGAGEGLDQPERADVERALLAAEPVHRLPCVVPVH